jgi:hypothetical protein
MIYGPDDKPIPSMCRVCSKDGNTVSVAARINNRLLFGCLLGLTAGLALCTYGHTANGYITGPVVVLGLMAGAVGTVVSAILLLLGRRPISVWMLAAFSISTLCVLIFVPLVWPYPVSSPPMPLNEVR